ncbi:iron complex transport system ATP-binding protein [Streptomyces zagrosensis]|uniref:Iron complex transport system ATP-binding protein n=1 Tax=Streptomyces zagrosensis TaxID=1042984 RepID=A0A7W9Q6C9_9ACTN|nr:iron complex transport system ATP-binding protein [Streptomyces zagrosensis]
MKLTVDGLHVVLDHQPILRDVSLEAQQGDIVGLIGPNGSGKSTLLRAVYRSLRPARGVVRVAGDDVWKLPARAAARRTAAVLQDSAGTAVGLCVKEIVALGRTPHHGLLGRDGADDHRAVEEALDACGARTLEDRDFASLSGGERQRVLLARALAQRPKLLVLDELTNHLDIRARFELLDLIRGTGTTTLAVLHDLDLAARLCDHLVVLNEGTVAAAGPVLDVLTTEVLREVFGVQAVAERHADGVIRITYGANPLAIGRATEPLTSAVPRSAPAPATPPAPTTPAPTTPAAPSTVPPAVPHPAPSVAAVASASAAASPSASPPSSAEPPTPPPTEHEAPALG